MRCDRACSVLLMFMGASVLAQDQVESPRTTPPSRAASSPRPTPSDRPLPPTAGKLITFEIVVADSSEPLSSPSAAKILELAKAGKLTAVASMQLTALENLPAFVQFGELAPRVVGRTTTGAARGGFGDRGPASSTPIYNDVNVGTIVQITARVEDDGAVVAQLFIERSGMPPTPRNPAAADQDPPPGIARLSTQTTIRATPGQPLLVSGRQLGGANDTSQNWIVLLANIAAPK